MSIDRIEWHAIPRDRLTPAKRAAMFALLQEHFDGVMIGQFYADLNEKNQVILLERGGRLVGFSTLLVYETRFEGEPVSVVYSGDTIVAPEAWRSPVLSRAWIATVNRLRGEYPHGRYYWLLLTSGFRTYRFLPVFWREFYPRFNQPAPAGVHRLINFLAVERFGPAYDVGRGIVRFPRPQRLRAHLASIPDGRVNDPEVEYFLARNPGHVAGDELVCLTELCEANLTAAGRRMIDHPKT